MCKRNKLIVILTVIVPLVLLTVLAVTTLTGKNDAGNVTAGTPGAAKPVYDSGMTALANNTGFEMRSATNGFFGFTFPYPKEWEVYRCDHDQYVLHDLGSNISINIFGGSQGLYDKRNGLVDTMIDFLPRSHIEIDGVQFSHFGLLDDAESYLDPNVFADSNCTALVLEEINPLIFSPLAVDPANGAYSAKHYFFEWAYGPVLVSCVFPTDKKDLAVTMSDYIVSNFTFYDPDSTVPSTKTVSPDGAMDFSFSIPEGFEKVTVNQMMAYDKADVFRNPSVESSMYNMSIAVFSGTRQNILPNPPATTEEYYTGRGDYDYYATKLGGDLNAFEKNRRAITAWYYSEQPFSNVPDKFTYYSYGEFYINDLLEKSGVDLEPYCDETGYISEETIAQILHISAEEASADPMAVMKQVNGYDAIKYEVQFDDIPNAFMMGDIIYDDTNVEVIMILYTQQQRKQAETIYSLIENTIK